MRSAKFGLALLLGGLTFFDVGCNGTLNQRAWVRSQGGLIRDIRQEKANDAFALLGQPTDGVQQVQVLENGTAGAFAWPDGDVFVTRGLVDLLNSRELAAALAHELGHLVDEGQLQNLVALRGCAYSSDAEARADAFGARLLVSRGIPSSEMIAMLRKVRAAPGIPRSCRQMIDHRIRLLEAQAISEPSSAGTLPAVPLPRTPR